MTRMKSFNKILVALLMVTMPLMASAQFIEKASQRMEIATVESGDDGFASTEYEVFKMNDDGSYWLSVGHLGIGGDIVQLQFDPLYELFIPLGDTIDEAIGTMQDLKDLYKKPKLSTTEVKGCLAAAYPSENLETVTLTNRRLLASKLLEFSVKRDDFIRATYIDKSSLGSLLNSLKFYKKLHPKEQ